MQLLRSSDGALPSPHSLQRPPALEAWRAGQGWQCVPLLSVPDGQTVQLLLSSDGALPSPHSLHRPPALAT